MPMTDWASLLAQGHYDKIASALIDVCDFDVLALSESPYRTIKQVITINVQEKLQAGCGGGGYYKAKPPTIYLHPSIARRNNFTLLHELGHHLQQHHTELHFALLNLSAQARKRAEEKISDEVASQILIPWTDEPLDACYVHPAELMAGLFEATKASRSAVLERVIKLLPETAKWILVVTDLEGVVQHGHSTYDDRQPAKGSRQPGLKALAEQAADGPVRRRFHEGIRYRNGSELHDMLVEAVLDHEGHYLFAALTPEARFGTGRIDWPVYECSNPACGKTFEAKWVKRHCDKCDEPACSWCDRCSCDPTATKITCDKCFMPWAPEEVAAGHHDC